MSKADFFDSNVLLYLPSEEYAKAAQVEALLETGGTISVQVLNEFAAVAIRKFGLSVTEVRRALKNITDVCTVVVIDIETHKLGLETVERYKFSVYDSMLLAAAQRANCTTFFTEDLHHGQMVGGLTIRNPFKP